VSVNLHNGSVYTWGFDDDGRLGHGSPGHRLSPCKVALISEKIAQIACGCWHSAALSVDGAVYTWGRYEPATDQPLTCPNVWVRCSSRLTAPPLTALF
jgi:alpha-tubulin suppressor-like RCC1 family protein